MTLPRITVIGTGENIFPVFSDNPEALEYLEFGIRLTVAEVLERVPARSRVAQPEPENA